MGLFDDAIAHTLATQGKALAERLDRIIELLEEIKDRLPRPPLRASSGPLSRFQTEGERNYTPVVLHRLGTTWG